MCAARLAHKKATDAGEAPKQPKAFPEGYGLNRLGNLGLIFATDNARAGNKVRQALEHVMAYVHGSMGRWVAVPHKTRALAPSGCRPFFRTWLTTKRACVGRHAMHTLAANCIALS